MKRRDFGFTLLEVLLALTLASALMVGMVGSLHLVREGWARVIGQDDDVQALSAARRFVQRTLASSYPALESKTQSPHVNFLGDERHLEFVTPRPTHFDTPGMYRVRVGVAPERKLLVQYAVERDDVSWEGTAVYPLLDEVDTFSLRYYGQRAHGMPRQWYSNWSAGPTMPDAVRLSLTRHAMSTAWTVELRAVGAELAPQ